MVTVNYLSCYICNLKQCNAILLHNYTRVMVLLCVSVCSGARHRSLSLSFPLLLLSLCVLFLVVVIVILNLFLLPVSPSFILLLSLPPSPSLSSSLPPLSLPPSLSLSLSLQDTIISREEYSKDKGTWEGGFTTREECRWKVSSSGLNVVSIAYIMSCLDILWSRGLLRRCWSIY